MTHELHDVTGVLLCGGRGSRLGGVDKPLQLLGDRPLAAHALGRLAAAVPQWIISANRNLTTYAEFGWPVVTDGIEGAGPLAGIEAAARVSRTPWLFICPGDAPFPDPNLPHALYRRRHGANAVHACGEGREQPLHLLVRTRRARQLSDRLRNGRGAVHTWLAELGSRAQPVAVAPETWANVNLPEDLRGLRDRHRAAAV